MTFESCRDAYRGIAGPLYVLSRLARCGVRVGPDHQPALLRAIDRLSVMPLSGSVRLPGLYFGTAGEAVVLTELLLAGLIADNTENRERILGLISPDFDWPDLTHGAAGQGLAALHLAAVLEDPRFQPTADAAATYLCRAQSADGGWVLPPGVDGLSGQSLTGFAHGVAGILYFLAEYAAGTGNSEAYGAVERAVDYLVRRAVVNAETQADEWPYSDVDSSHWRWWCHGSPGIALALLRLFERFRDNRHADAARRALRQQPVGIRAGNLGQCHGLAGLGEVYLEAARVLKDDGYRRCAWEIAGTILALARKDAAGRFSWLVEGPDAVTADLMVGTSGIFHFMLRLAGRAELLGPPLLANPA
jgi:lantibiotic modifying enzyme